MKSCCEVLASGDMLGHRIKFNIHNTDTFRTVFGFFMSVISLLGLAMVFWYFLARYFDHTDPKIQYNKYRSDQYYDGDLTANNFHFYWVPWHKKNSATIGYEEFMKSFKFQGVITTSSFELDPIDPKKQLNPVYSKGKVLEFVPCSQADWVKKLPETISTPSPTNEKKKSKNINLLQVMKKYGICLNEKEMHIFHYSGQKRNLNIELVKCGAKNWFKDVRGAANPGDADPYRDQCDHKLGPDDLELEMMLFNKNPIIHDHDKPFHTSVRYLDYTTLSETTYKHTYYDLREMKIKTDVGLITPKYVYETSADIQQKGNELRARDVSDTNNPYWVVRAWSGDEKIEIKRSYIE
jgi:hypothetical protein